MKEDYKKLWVEALRSGNYPQSKGALHKTGQGYCCLGVLCEVVNEAHAGFVSTMESMGKRYYEGSSADVPEPIRNLVGIHSRDAAVIVDDEKVFLSELNDEAGYTFNQIADIIEEQL